DVRRHQGLAGRGPGSARGPHEPLRGGRRPRVTGSGRGEGPGSFGRHRAHGACLTCTCRRTGESDTTMDEGESMSTTIVDVERMTCGNCVKHVTDEISALEGVSAVDVDLSAGGVSAVTFTTAAPLGQDDLRAAVDEAGYSVTAIR